MHHHLQAQLDRARRALSRLDSFGHGVPGRSRRRARVQASWYRLMFESAAVGILIADADQRIVTCNQTLADMLGYPGPEELAGLTRTDLTYPGTEAAPALPLERLQRGEIDRYTVEQCYRRKDGSPIWLRAGAARIPKSTLHFSFFEDIHESRLAQEQLREKTALLERAQQVGGVGSWVWYPSENRSVWSEETRRILGFSLEEAASQDPDLFFSSIHPDDREWFEPLGAESFAAGTPVASEYRIVRRSDGELRWVSEQAIVERFTDGSPSRVLGAIMDITERKRTEDDLREAAAELVRAQQLGRVGSWAWYPHEERNVWSQEARRIYGFSDEQADAGNPDLFFDVVHPDDRDELFRKTWKAFETGTSSAVEHRILLSSGEVRWVRGQGDVELDAQGRPYRLVGVVIDITDQKVANAELERLAFTDPLTGLTNRTSFNRRLDLAVEQAEREGGGSLAVLYIDLDDFKLVNDSFGHEAGDQLLRETASRLRARSREVDLIGRQGGDEFLVMLAGMDADAAERVARNLIDELRAPFAVLGADVHLSASVGISLYPFDASSGEELLKHADVAMYAAKQAGRNNAQVFAHSSDSAYAQISLTTSLHHALERDELELYYQPVFNLETGAVLSVEALIRWNHPERGLVLPGEFIAAAERNGLIAPISNWVAMAACRQAATWRDQLLDLPVAFNLPPALWQPGLMRHLLAIMEELDLPADRMIVEITESALNEDLGRAEPLVEQLRDAGLRLAIDDFGTGHSSLSRLAKLPVSTLKIDRSFIRDIPGDQAAATLVASIIQLSNNLGLEPLAEGIETPAQRDFLIGKGCTVGQGFLLSKPVPAEEIAALCVASLAQPRRRAA
jgi:diguanylate cyclase (GGDEF)-like protein/PAS domain S-box-containing protein